MGLHVSLDEAVVRSFMLNATILLVKMLLMSTFTSMNRLAKGIFANKEDATYFAPKDAGKVKLDDVDIERIRRSHLNDLENIPAFLFMGALYVVTLPNPRLASILFSAYTLCRVGHSLVYAVWPQPQPARFIFYAGGLAITLYMASQVAIHAIL